MITKSTLINAAFWGEWVCLPCGYVEEEASQDTCPHCGELLGDAEDVLVILNLVEDDMGE